MTNAPELSHIVQEIQYVLAPAVMISSTALLLLGFQNKFSALVNRFRMLNQEKRQLSLKSNRTAAEDERLQNLIAQVQGLTKRATHMKNAIMLAYAAIMCFVVTSILLFLRLYTKIETLHLTLVFFLLGLILLLVDSILLMAETFLAYQVVRLEKKSI